MSNTTGMIGPSDFPLRAMQLNSRVDDVKRSFAARESTGARNTDADLKKACSEMTSLFVDQLFKAMRATVPKSDLFGGGKAEEIYTEMLDQEYAKLMVQEETLGLSSRIRSSLGTPEEQ